MVARARANNTRGLINPTQPAAQMKKMREEVSRSLKVTDVTKLPDYAPQAVVRAAVGNGRLSRYLSNSQLSAKHQGLIVGASNTKGSMVDAVDAILNSGGSFASTLQKLERGIPVGGKSPGRDMQTGGAD